MAGHGFRDYFQIVTADGKEKAACTICGRVIANNVGCMRMHYTKVHEKGQLPSQPRRADDDSQSDDAQSDDSSTSPMYATDLQLYLERMRALDHGDVVKRTVKYLAVCPNPQLFNAVVHAAPDDVIAAIGDAALNVREGDVELTEPQKRLFRTHHPAFLKLVSPTFSIKRKRKLIESQSGGFPFLPILIATALGAFGSRLFGDTSSNQQQ